MFFAVFINFISSDSFHSAGDNGGNPVNFEIHGRTIAVMERNRDSRRATVSAANCLPRRRQRITTLRDSIGEKKSKKKIFSVFNFFIDLSVFLQSLFMDFYRRG